MIFYMYGFYIGQNYSSVQYKIKLIENEDIANYVISLYEDDKINKKNIDCKKIEYIIDSCSNMNDGIDVKLYRWEIDLEY